MHQSGSNSKDKRLPILPPAWLGILGGGQLGRMFVHEAQSLGFKVCVLDPDPLLHLFQFWQDLLPNCVTRLFNTNRFVRTQAIPMLLYEPKEIPEWKRVP